MNNLKKKNMKNGKIAVETKIAVTISQKVAGAIMIIAGISAAVGFAASILVAPITNQVTKTSCSLALLPTSTPNGDVEVRSDQFELIRSTDSISQAVEDNLMISSDALERRKQLLFETMHSNANIALSTVMSDSQLRSYFSNTDGCIENFKTVEGVIEMYTLELIDGRHDVEYQLLVPDNSRLILHPANNAHTPLVNGATVKISGYEVDGHILFDSSSEIVDSAPDNQESGFTEIQAASTATTISGPQKTVFLLTHFDDDPQPGISISTVQNRMDEVNNYYVENSFGEISIESVLDTGESADVRGWYPVSSSQNCAFINNLLQAAMTAADAEIDFTQYDHLEVHATFDDCGWAGKSSNGKVPIITPDSPPGTPSMMSWSVYLSSSAGLYMHEMGHGIDNLGEAPFLDCGPLSIGSDCTEVIYGDLYDVMGAAHNINGGHLNTLSKDRLGWLSGTQLQTVTTSGTRILEPYSSQTAGLKALKIPRGVNEYLTVEFRQPIGYDQVFELYPPSWEGNWYDGAIFHISNTTFNPTYLIDPTPPGDSAKSALEEGESFTDPATKTVISIIDVNRDTVTPENSRLTVQVTAGKTDFIPPVVNLTAPSPGSTVSGVTTVSATASDAETSISRVEFYIDNDGSPFAEDTTAPYQISFDTQLVENGSHSLKARAYDSAGDPWSLPNNYNDSAFVAITVSNTDSTPPSVTLVAPSGGGTSINPVDFEATASDNVGISRVEFFANFSGTPTLLTTANESPYTGWYDFYNHGEGNVEMWARAYDFVGNFTNSAHVTTYVTFNYHPGWTKTTGDSIYSSPAFADIDVNYPGLEVIIGSIDNKLYAWHQNGTPVWTYNANPGDPGADISSSPAVADIDPAVSGLESSVSSSDGYLHVIRANGIQRWKQDIGAGLVTTSSPAIGNIDTGELEVVVGSYDENIYVWNYYGALKFKFLTQGPVRATPAIGEVHPATTGKEIVVGTTEGKVHVISKVSTQGADMAGWPQVACIDLFCTIVDEILGSAAIGDIDPAYPGNEVVVGSMNGRVYAWHYDGTQVIPNPGNMFKSIGHSIEASPVLADLDISVAGLEIIVADTNGDVYAWHGDGTPVIGWPQDAGFGVLASPAIADLDNNGSPEIIVGALDEKVYAWHTDGSRVTGWPKKTGNTILSSPAVADLDGNGSLEVAVGNFDGKVHIWTTSGVSSVRAPWPMFGHDPTRAATSQNTCSDGTVYYSCMTNLPKYCNGGIEDNRCNTCGCSSGLNCQTDGTCQEDVCYPDCLNKVCGYSCGQPCGVCDTGYICSADQTRCVPVKTCFLRGTSITLADGSTKMIEDISIGDKVLSFDEQTNTFAEGEVVTLFEHQTDDYLILNGHTRVTPNHSYYMNDTWTQIGDLSVGDTILGDSGRQEVIRSLEIVKDDVMVYNFEVSPYATYIADGMVVHNAGPGKTRCYTLYECNDTRY